MVVQSSTSNSPFELFPVHIPGWVSPVSPENTADGGITKRIYDNEPDGCECWIDPLTEFQERSGTMAAGDRVDLYVNDDPTPVDGATVKAGEEANRIVLHIPHGRLRNGVNRLHYKVRRISGNSEDSRDLLVLYHLLSPGANDPDDTVIDMDLVIPSDVEQDGISVARAAEGVRFGFNYANQRAHDTVRFQLGTETIPLDVTSPSEPMATTLYTETFRRVGDNPRTFARFSATDQLGNFNQSAPKYLDIHLDQLTAPVITSVQDRQGNDIPEGGLTLDTSLTVTGTASNGDVIQLYGNGSPIGSQFNVTGTSWSHQLSNLTVNVYSVTARLVGAALESDPKAFTITQLIKPTLPKAYNTAGNRLMMGFRGEKDLYYDDYLTVVVPSYVGAHFSHILNVIWKGRVVTYTEPNPVSGQRELRVPREHFVDCIGVSADLTYTVQTSASSDALVSESLRVIVDEQDLPLPESQYDSSSRRVTVRDTSLMQNYKIRVRWDGVVTRDGPEVAVDISSPYIFTVDPTWVAENAGRTVLLNYTLRLDANNPILFSHYLRLPL